MINAEQIPDEVVEAAARAMWRTDEPSQWDLGMADIALRAGINAWPDVRHSIERNGSYPVLILPLTQEPSND
jgi:hypothetical protein